ncbi:MAG: 6-carboxytetrahydropterin synthase [Myxococcota bacterium]
MYSVTVRDRVMIAHSFQGEIFGPAQRSHGATYVVDAEFRRAKLDSDGLVIDIGLAHRLLAAVLEPWAYRDLDELPEFKGINTTTEYLAGEVTRRLTEALPPELRGPEGLASLAVTLKESDVAWARHVVELAG